MIRRFRRCRVHPLSRPRPPHPHLHLPDIELHHVNGPAQIAVAEGLVKILEGFLFLPVPQNRIVYVPETPALDGIRESAVPEVVDRRFGVEDNGFCRRSPISPQQVPKWIPGDMTASSLRGFCFLTFRPPLAQRCASQPLYWFQKSFIRPLMVLQRLSLLRSGTRCKILPARAGKGTQKGGRGRAWKIPVSRGMSSL